MSGRPDRLTYTGDGTQFYAGVPKRDLDAADIANLSDEQIAAITAPNPGTGKALYRVEKPAKPAAGKE